MTMTSAPLADPGEIAAMLSQITETEVTLVEGGFRIRETDTHYIDVLRMLFNWRVARTMKGHLELYDRHWCFAGTSFITLIRAVTAAAEWDGGDGTEPAGWNKNGQTGEWRKP
jgi:hypothetical protein